MVEKEILVTFISVSQFDCTGLHSWWWADKLMKMKIFMKIKTAKLFRLSKYQSLIRVRVITMMIFYHISSIRHKKKKQVWVFNRKRNYYRKWPKPPNTVRNQYLFCQQSDDGDDSRVRSWKLLCLANCVRSVSERLCRKLPGLLILLVDN